MYSDLPLQSTAKNINVDRIPGQGATQVLQPIVQQLEGKATITTQSPLSRLNVGILSFLYIR